MPKKNQKIKVLVSDKLGSAGMTELRKEKAFTVDERIGLTPAELKKIIKDYDAILIRSGTRLTKEILSAAKRLRVVGRAGVGVDNVDLEEATKRGIIVMNTPEGNTISTAEHSFSMIMALARRIPQAYASLKDGEWKRSSFTGTELNGKVLGVVGFGRIGREVTKRALAFNMRVVVFDPYISKEAAREHPLEFMELKDVLKIADFITVHTPLTPQTKYLLNDQTFKLCKKGVKIVNCARGGIIEEKALIKAIKAGIVSGAALDVFEEEPPTKANPLLGMPEVICTPHLGAATAEAQANVAIDVVRQVTDVLHDRAIKNAVNLPSLDSETSKLLRPWISLAEKIGMLHSQLYPGVIKKVTIRYGGDVAKHGLQPLTIAILKGLLTPICGATVNYVNAPTIAKERGIAVSENRSTEKEDFSNYIELEVTTGTKNKEKNSVMGTLFGNELPRIVRVNEFGIDLEPASHALFIHNEDKPGVVGNLGMILGKNKINIAEMSLGRVKKGKKMLAMTVINTDSDVSTKALNEIKKFPPIIDVKLVKL